jgi:hypothetical protein
MEKPEQNEGYFIVLKPKYVIERFENNERIQQYFEKIQQIRKVYSTINPKNYRGISREQLKPYACFEKSYLKQQEERDITDCGLARLRMGEIQKDLDLEWGGITEKLLRNCDNAKEILSLIKDNLFFEIIYVRRAPFSVNENTLGFDIGYFKSEFSIIADIAVIPQWHPSNPADDSDILTYFEDLNENVLFKNLESAHRFLEYYRTRPWAETEYYKVDFYVIQVDEVML